MATILALSGPSLATSPAPPVDVVATFDGSGAVGEPIHVRVVVRVSPNIVIDGDAYLDVPDLVRVEGPTRWPLVSERDRMTETSYELTLTPERAAYWRAWARWGDAGARVLLVARSEQGDGAIASYDESSVMPERAATVDASLGNTSAWAAEIVVTGAKGAGWQPHERLALAPAGHGHVSTVAGDGGEHREWLNVPEGHALAIQVTAYVEATFEGHNYGQAQGPLVMRKPAAMLCSTLARSGGNVTLTNAECDWPNDAWQRVVPGPPAVLALAAAWILARRR